MSPSSPTIYELKLWCCSEAAKGKLDLSVDDTGWSLAYQAVREPRKLYVKARQEADFDCLRVVTE